MSQHPDPENPQYCATTFLFAATLTKDEQALLAPVATCYSCYISDTERASQSNIDIQPADNRRGVTVESHADSQKDIYFGGTESRHITSSQQMFRTCQKTSTFSEVPGYESKLLTMDNLEIMSQSLSGQSLSGTAARLMYDTENELAQSSPKQVTADDNENSFGEITGDLEHDLRIQSQSPYEL